MTASMLSLVAGAVYPGGLVSPNWQLLWVQNVLLMFVQLTTGATLYAQNDRYSWWLTGPVRRVTAHGGRRLTLTIHALAGVTLVVVNCGFVYLWVAGQPADLKTLLVSRPTITLTTLAVTGGFVLMAVLGVSLYAELTPGTRLPVWRFGYALSRKLHRAVFVLVVGLLGYHVFLTPRVYLVWATWIRDMDPFGLLALAHIGIWGVLAGQSLLMLGEWATGDTFTRWTVDRTGRAGIAGAVVAVGAGLERSMLEWSLPVLTIGFVAAVLLGRHLLGRRQTDRERPS